MNTTNTNTTGIEEIKELFTQMGFFVKNVDINEKENLANVYISIDGTKIYTLGTLERKIEKIKELEQKLMSEGLIEYILMGDLYQGDWRILAYFKSMLNHQVIIDKKDL